MGWLNLKTLEEILKKDWDNIYIQTHDHPDVDALTSAFIVASLIKKLNYNNSVEIIYQGNVVKPNILNVIEYYEPKICNVSKFKKGLSLSDKEILITVDSQYGEDNITKVIAKNIIILDHHETGKFIKTNKAMYVDCDNRFCSCASLLEKYVRDYMNDRYLSELIYNGMYNDTNKFSKKIPSIDKDLKERLETGTEDIRRVDADLIFDLNREHINRVDLDIVIESLNRHDIYNNIAFVEVPECDNNILGYISDILAEVKGVDIVVAYSERETQCRLSIRSYDAFIYANEIIEGLTENIGGGGGHGFMAGGFISKELFEKNITTYNRIKAYIEEKTLDIYNSYDKYETGNKKTLSKINESDLLIAEKKPYAVRIIDINKYFKTRNLKIRILTKEGLLDVSSRYLVIGVEGEVYPITVENLYMSYRKDNSTKTTLSDEYTSKEDFKIELRSVYSNEAIEFTHKEIKTLPIYRVRDNKKTNRIKIYRLERPTKVITKWDRKPIYGTVGDYLSIRDDGKDLSVINKEILHKTYNIIEEV